MAEALAKAGRFDEAERVAFSVVGADGQALVLAAVGQFDEAERVARSVTIPYTRDHALAAVAEALVEAAEPDEEGPSSKAVRAAQLVAVVLTGREWRAVLPALTALVPDVAERIRDAVQRTK